MAVKILTEIKIKNAKAKDKLYRLFDGNGLCLKITSKNKKIWEYRYKNPDTLKDDTLALGDYPSLSLSDARQLHQTKRADVLKGINPKRTNEHLSFPFVFQQWWNTWSMTKSEKYAKQVYNAINNNCMAVLAPLKINEIEVQHLVRALQPFEDRNALEYLHRTKTGLNQLFDFAISRGLCNYNPAMMISRKAFKSHQSTHHKSIGQKQIYKLFDFFQSEEHSITTRLCTELTLRSITRIQESCKAQWSEIDFHNKLWIIPAERMKMSREHIIPLTPQMITIFQKMYNISRDLPFVFPSLNLETHICLETPRTAIQRFGIDSTIHGFRHLASTLLNESGLFRPDVIEASLAHQDKNSIRATYNKAQYLNERRELFKWWNDFLDHCTTLEDNKSAITALLLQ